MPGVRLIADSFLGPLNDSIQYPDLLNILVVLAQLADKLGQEGSLHAAGPPRRR